MNETTDEELAELNLLVTKRIRRLEYQALSRPIHEAMRVDVPKVTESMRSLLAGPRADSRASYEKLAASLEKADETRQKSIESIAADLALHTARTAALEELLQRASR